MRDFAFLLTVTLGLLVGCTSPSSNQSVAQAWPAREPASSALNEQNEIAFQVLLHAADITSSLQLKINQLEESYYRGQDLLEAYDQSIDQAATPGRKIYARLQALEALTQSVQDKLVYDCLRLKEISRDPAAVPADVAAAKAALAYTHTYLSRTPLSTRIALNPWAEALHERAPDMPELQRPYAHLFVANFDGLQALMKQPAVTAHEMKMRFKLRHKRGFFLTRLDDLAQTFEGSADLRIPSSVSTSLPSGQWALALGGGPMRASTVAIADDLRAARTPATFFFLGEKIDSHADIVKAVADRGLAFGDFSESRPELNKLFVHEFRAQIHEPIGHLMKAIGQSPVALLAPYAVRVDDPEMISILDEAHLHPVQQTLSSFNWIDHQPVRVANRIAKQVAVLGSGVILINEGLTESRQDVREILEALARSKPGLTFTDFKGVAHETAH